MVQQDSVVFFCALLTQQFANARAAYYTASPQAEVGPPWAGVQWHLEIYSRFGYLPRSSLKDELPIQPYT